MATGPRAALRMVRGTMARATAAAIDRWPALEPAFVRAGRAVARHRPLASLYYEAHTHLIARLRSGGRRYRRMTFHGVGLDVDITDHSARLLYFHGAPYEPVVTRILVETLSAGDVCIDVGANAGFFTALAAVRVGPSGHVVAFEPHPGAREAMQALVNRNGVADRVTIVGAAVGNRVARSVPLHLSSDSVLSTLVPDHSPLAADYPFDRSIEVPLTTIDTWMGGSPALTPRIAAIKIDVEGFEGAVVDGMTATIAAASRAIVICETSPDSAADRALYGAGFSVEPLETDARGFGNYLYRRRS